MSTLVETAYAKINLALHIRKRRADGYHDLETIFAFVDEGDRLTAIEGDEVTLSISGPFSASLECDDSNLVFRAARLLQAHFGLQMGANLTLEKNLPVSSGIGGGSADAAAAARMLNRLWRIDADDEELEVLIAPLGADVPACISSRMVIGMGTGTDLCSVTTDEFSGIPVLLVNPLKPVSTGTVFSRWDGVDRGSLKDEHLMTMVLEGRNDLQPIAISLCPDIADILAALENTSPFLARMSGSGATCFALYESITARDEAEAAMREDWWTLSSLLR